MWKFALPAAYLDLVANEEVRDIFWLNAPKRVLAMRRFLDGEGFLEVENAHAPAHLWWRRCPAFVTHHLTP